MKVTGAELIAFLGEAWPQPEDDGYWDHVLFFDDPDPAETYDTYEIGPIRYQGRHNDPTDGEGYDLAACIRKWRRERDNDVLAVLVPKDRVAEFKKTLKSFGAKLAERGG
jgi:hypothetical protein